MTGVQTCALPIFEGLICAVKRGVQEGVIAPEQEQPLLAKLYAARASRDRGQVTAEINQLQAEVHLLEAQDGLKIEHLFDVRMIGWVEDLVLRLSAPTPVLRP